MNYKNIAIHTKTQEEWDQITELFDIKWNYGKWEINKEESVILILDESLSLFNTCSIHYLFNKIEDNKIHHNIYPAYQIIRDIKLNKIIKD